MQGYTCNAPNARGECAFIIIIIFPYDIYRFLLKSLMTDASGIVLDF